MKEESLNRQTGAWAVGLAKSDPLTIGSSDHFDSVAQKASAARQPLTINVFSLIMRRSSVAGWYSGTAKDSQDTLEFSALSGVRPMIERYSLDRVAEAYDQMHSGRVRFRVVLTFG